jgi:RNA polymerase sigma-70 factor (ECF subfamily)
MDRSATEIARWIRMAREGREDALGALLAKSRNYLRLLAATCLHRELRGKADPSDVVQDTFLKVHENFHDFRGTTDREWMAWVRRILVRNLADLQRKYAVPGRDVGRERSLDDVADRSSALLRDLVPARGGTPSEQARNRETGMLVADALAELDEGDREVVILRTFHELEWGEVSERTGRSPDAARMAWARALQRLGGLLEARVT